MYAILLLLCLCWGSFLNVVGYRLIQGKNIAIPRSFCPHCKEAIGWYDNIPIISWILLRGKCRNCSHNISVLYPFIELLTPAIILPLYYTVPHIYFVSYFIFFSALIVTIRSDFETMLISRFVTLFMVPIGMLLAWTGYLPISLLNSIAGALLGYGFLYVVARIFYLLTGKEGIGQGDLELLAFIGSFIGVLGCWISLFLGSVIGSVLGIGYILLCRKQHTIKLPFGPFLSAGAIVYVLFHHTCISFLSALCP